MKLRSILLSATLALSLVACTSPRNIGNTNADHDIVQIDDLTIKLINHGILKEGSVKNYNQQVQAIYDNLADDQVLYMVEVEILSDNYDQSLDFSATDSSGKELKPSYLALEAGETEIGNIFFVFDKETKITALNSIIEKDGVESRHSFTITDPDAVTELNEMEKKPADEAIDRIVLNTIKPVDDLYISIHESSSWDFEMLSENEKSTLKSHLSTPDKNVLRLEYTIRDDRPKSRPIDRIKNDEDTDLITPYIISKDGTKIEPIYSQSLRTESDKETYNKDYFIVENSDDIEDIYFDLDIDNDKIDPMAIGYGYDK